MECPSSKVPKGIGFSEGVQTFLARLRETPAEKEKRARFEQEERLIRQVLASLSPEELKSSNKHEYLELLQLIRWKIAEHANDFELSDEVIKELAPKIAGRSRTSEAPISAERLAVIEYGIPAFRNIQGGLPDEWVRGELSPAEQKIILMEITGLIYKFARERQGFKEADLLGLAEDVLNESRRQVTAGLARGSVKKA